MRFGGPIFADCPDPAAWMAELRRLGYSAAYCPLKADADDATVRAYAAAAEAGGVVIAEVGAWSNPLAPDRDTREQALQTCRRQLHLAERIGARCCVNIAGSRGGQWDGPDPANLTEETFDAVVQSVRAILDDVQPQRTFYTLETMPWMYPDSTDSYLRLVRAVDRPRFAVHFDPVNLVCSPQAYYGNGAMIRDFVRRLGGHIRSVHLKDIALSGKLTVHLDEVRPGLGGLDYPALLTELDRLDPDLPVLLEHLPSAAEYEQAAAFVRSAAEQVGAELR